MPNHFHPYGNQAVSTPAGYFAPQGGGWYGLGWPNATIGAATGWRTTDPNDIEFAAKGLQYNIPPATVVNFLIACGVSGSATPSTRSGEVHRLHAQTDKAVAQAALDGGGLSEISREMYEATLAGEPWPPPVNS